MKNGDKEVFYSRLLELLQRIAVSSNEALSEEQAIQLALDEICALTCWPIGHALRLGKESQHLQSTRVWHFSGPGFTDFKTLTESLTFKNGEGLPGRVLATGKAEWISDIHADQGFIRAKVSAAATSSIKSAFAFPILTRDEVVGVLEFFSPIYSEPDEAFLKVMVSIGAQLGRVVERRKAFEALSVSEIRTRRIIESAGEAFVSMDERGVVIDWNNQAETTFGWTRKEALGKFMTELIIPPRFRDPHKTGLAHYLKTGEGPVLFKRIQVFALHRKGHEIPVELAITPLRLEEGHSFQAFLYDISDRLRQEKETKKAEEELREARAMLERRVVERTQELEHANLNLKNEIAIRKRQTEELARSNAELSQFAHVASHDLKEPLRTVRTYVQLLEKKYKDSVDDQGREYIGFVVGGAARMYDLINDLLSYSAVGKADTEFTDADLNRVLENALQGLATQIVETGAKVTSSPLPTLRSNPSQLVQLFQNLIANALKFRGEEKTAIHISAERRGDEYVFSVRDNGIGIAAEYRERVFLMFQRLHSREKYPGTGIGLTICRKIVERHGGRIWVESEPGKGATFFFTLSG